MKKNDKIEYKKIDQNIQNQIIEDRQRGYINPYKCNDENVIRRVETRDKPNLWRPAFVRDTEKILHLPVYNRYADKTQVFSFYKNDDITRRALHVQIVSRIARSIGNVLGLNVDLIESISLGHDLGHTPFGHAGETFLSNLLEKETGLFFNHNVHSVRILDSLFQRNVSLQTLDGILCHNGEFEMQEYRPRYINSKTDHKESFAKFDSEMQACYKTGAKAIKKLVPCTLEACVVRICDMIAYLGKDRQDSITAKITTEKTQFSSSEIGISNANIINNLTVDIINNSYGKDYILLSEDHYRDLKIAKKENYEKIYLNPELSSIYDDLIQPMFNDIYYRLLDDITKENHDSVIWKHHINYVKKHATYYDSNLKYEENDPNLIVTDYIASMTDDYFIDLYSYLFPNKNQKVAYKSYFDDE